MIDGIPSPFAWSLSASRSTGIEPFVRRHVDRYWFYGSGKTALRDGLSVLPGTGTAVLLPSYVPDAVSEPLLELGLEPRHYAITDGLAPEIADLEARLDDDVVAITSVNYFGFPQPGLESIVALADEYDCYHVDDSAHAALSVHDGTLLGTSGDVGITSLWKLLPVPDGALLYVTDETLAARFEPSSLAGWSDRVDGQDCRFVASTLASRVLDHHATMRRSMDTLVPPGWNGASIPGPADRYEASKRPMSKLSRAVVASADPEAVRRARRENYDAWQRIFDARSDVRPFFDDVPEGICPKAFPLVADDPERVLDELERCGVTGAYTWPRLSRSVREDPAYETATYLSSHVIAVPVHQHVDRETIEAAGRRLLG